MNASTVDLRYRTRDVLRSLDRGESVVITFRGKTRGIIHPPAQERGEQLKIAKHPYFGSAHRCVESVDDVMDVLRGGRYRGL